MEQENSDEYGEITLMNMGKFYSLQIIAQCGDQHFETIIKEDLI
jgi:hypothetical protein